MSEHAQTEPQQAEQSIEDAVQEIARSIQQLSNVEYHLQGLRDALPGARSSVFADVERWRHERTHRLLIETFEVLEQVSGVTDHALRQMQAQREDS